MASNRLLNVSDQVRGSRKTFHGSSKSQSSLSKILDIISCFSEVKSSKVSFDDDNDDDDSGKRGFGLDLNHGLVSSPLLQIDDDNDDRIAVIDQRTMSECSVVARDQVIIVDDDDDNNDDVDNNGELGSEEIETKHESSNTRDGGSLGLLIDAARLISSGEFDDDDESAKNLVKDDSDGETKTRRGNRRREKGQWGKEWNGGYEDADEDEVSAVVRTKRVRSRVLPYRYRDSVIDPTWKQLRNKKSTGKKRCGPF